MRRNDLFTALFSSYDCAFLEKPILNAAITAATAEDAKHCQSPKPS
jgi:hypothetical protein